MNGNGRQGGRIQGYVSQAGIYMTQAQKELALGDMRQASEKAWGAASQIIKAIATQRRWRHGRHSNLSEIVDRVHAETGDDEFQTMFGLADQLHANFYEGFLSDPQVEVYIDQASRFVEKMRGLLDGEG